jgi:hypothetical protein
MGRRLTEKATAPWFSRLRISSACYNSEDPIGGWREPARLATHNGGNVQVLVRTVTILIGLGILTACSHSKNVHSEPGDVTSSPTETAPGEQRVVLAGEWEYEDSGIVQTLVLDDRGNGNYSWQNGVFMTTSLAGHSWSGSWLQRQNDREGRFEVRLSPDYSEGEGRWWYTRIDMDTQPRQKGGAFHIRRVRPSDTVNHALR